MQAKPGFEKRTKNYMKTALIAVVSCFLTVACAPPRATNNTPAPAPTVEPKVEKPLVYQAPATPTVNIPKEVPPGEQPFQAPPATAISKDNKTIILNSMVVNVPSSHYSALDKKLSIVGEVEIKHGENELLAKKVFSLVGTHKENESTFILIDLNDTKNPDLLVRAQASCIGINNKNQFDCSHIVIDIIARYKDKTYSKQLETKHQIAQTPVPQAQPPVTPTPQTPPAQPVRPAPPELQSEDPDQSIDGGFNNTLPNVDLGKLFPTPGTPPANPPQAPAPQQPPVKPAPAPQPPQTPPVKPQPPAVKPQPPVKPISPPAQPPTKPVPPVVPVPAPPTAPVAPVAPTPDLLAPTEDKIISENILETPQGLLRPYNQSTNFPNDGTLRNATSILDLEKTGSNSSLFELSFPGREKHYTTFEMSQIVVRAAKFLFDNFQKKLFVSNGSLIEGGPVPPHASHQNGLDIDLGYPTPDNSQTKFPVVVTESSREFHTKEYSTEKTYKLLKHLFAQTDIVVERVFIDQYIIDELCEHAIKNEDTPEGIAFATAMFDSIQHIPGHGDHLHVRIKCSTRDLGCRSRSYRKMNNCDFKQNNDQAYSE